MRRGKRYYRKLLVITWVLLLFVLTGCAPNVEYVRDSSKPYKLPNGDVCMSPAAFADLMGE